MSGSQWWACTNPEVLRGRCRFERVGDHPLKIKQDPALIIDGEVTPLFEDPNTGHCLRFGGGGESGTDIWLQVYCEQPPSLGLWLPLTGEKQ